MLQFRVRWGGVGHNLSSWGSESEQTLVIFQLLIRNQLSLQIGIDIMPHERKIYHQPIDYKHYNSIVNNFLVTVQQLERLQFTLFFGPFLMFKDFYFTQKYLVFDGQHNLRFVLIIIVMSKHKNNGFLLLQLCCCYCLQSQDTVCFEDFSSSSTYNQ